MKKTICPLTLIILSLLFAGCSKSTKSTSSTTTTNPYGYDCTLYPTALGCSGSTTGGTTSGTSTGVLCTTVTSTSYNCTNYCQYFTNGYNCSPSGINCNINPNGTDCTSSTNGNTYGSLYPQGVPTGSCSEATGSGYDTRKATMTIVGGSWYNPSSPEASLYYNTSAILKSVSTAKTLFTTDSVVKVRLKVKEQPTTAQVSNVCYGRTTGASIPGYTKLKFKLSVAPVTSNNALGVSDYVGQYEVGVNSCSTAIDLSPYKAMYPNGFVVIISEVLSNQECSNYNYTTGFQNCTVFGPVRTKDCWAMDLEVAVDGTKSF